MRNWHHKIIKLIPILLFVFGFGQDSDTIKCGIFRKNDSILYSNLKKESGGVNYEKLTKKIINDIKWDSLKKPNLIFYIEDVGEKPILISGDAADFYSYSRDCSWRNE